MAGPAARDLLRHLRALTESGEPHALATVVAIQGSASAKPGAKLIVNARGERVFGWVGGGCAETTVRDEALQAMQDGRARLIRLDLDDEVLGVGMPCGGNMSVYIEPVLPQPMLMILGHGTIAETLVAMGKLLEFRVAVNDPLATADAFPGADLRIQDDPDYAKVDCDTATYVVITTQHKSDYEALARVLRQKPAYVGLVASRKRSALVIDRLYEDGFAREDLQRISAPCGLDLGSQTPQEIALSILAEVMQRVRGAGSTGRPLWQVKGVRIDGHGVEIPEGGLGGDKCPK